jgi:hypothetical protein
MVAPGGTDASGSSGLTSPRKPPALVNVTWKRT